MRGLRGSFCIAGALAGEAAAGCCLKTRSFQPGPCLELFHVAARFLLSRVRFMTSNTEIMVIDSPRAAAWALENYRPRHERAHLLCRATGEQAPAFGTRVLERLCTIRRRAEVLGLTLVCGADPTFNQLLPELSHKLASNVSPSGIITFVGVGACQLEVVGWFESLRMVVAPTIMLGMSFPVL